MDVHPDTKITKKDGYDIVFISHGLSNNKHSHTSNAYFWVSRGFIVVALQHNEKGRIVPP